MKPSDIPHIARHLMDKYGLTVGNGWTFRLDNARRRAGLCSHWRKTIFLSRHYVALNTAERPGEVVDTILHEIAHGLAGWKAGHGPEWKMVAESIGARPKRCYDSSVVSMPKGKVVATCSGCHTEFRRHKAPRKSARYYCTKCGPELGKLTYKHENEITIQPITTTDTPPPPNRLR